MELLEAAAFGRKEAGLCGGSSAAGDTGGGGATLMGGIGSSAAPMNGYPKVFNIESDPHEQHNIGEMYNWVLGPLLKVVEEYKASVEQSPNPPAANMTRF